MDRTRQVGLSKDAWGLADRFKQLHFSTAQAYSDIYSQSAKWNKDATVYGAVADETSSFGMTSYQAAKSRREIVQPFYSRRSVLNMQDALHRQVLQLATPVVFS